MNSRLFQRDFTIMILGQIISLFGNAILRFSLSLYVLEVTGSAAVFGTILAVSMIPTVLLSPFGGVLADRLPKQKIMTILDFVTAGLIVFYDAVYGSAGNLAAVTIFMILLTLIQAFYQPSVQASIPLLASQEQLMAANGIVMQADPGRDAVRDWGCEAHTCGQRGLLFLIGGDGTVSAYPSREERGRWITGAYGTS